ncbi:ABC transporter permease [Lachnospiraceae bacterium 54-53]
MLKYMLKRILLMIPVILSITFLVFLVLSISPGDPALMALGGQATADEIAEKQVEMGLDQPVIVQYVKYMSGAVRGDFGTSWYQGFDVMNEFSHRIPYTLSLGFLSIIVAIAIGIPIGVIAAVRHNKVTDYVVTFLALILASAPAFWLGMIYQMFFALKLGWVPASGADSWKSFILPTLSLSGGILAADSRTTRTWLLDVIRSDYVRTARAKGNKEITVIMKHALRNSLLPVITQIGVSFSIVMGGSVITETVYSFPGIGSYLINAVKTKDIPIVMACITIISIVVGITNLLVDLTYAIVDPRVQTGQS